MDGERRAAVKTRALSLNGPAVNFHDVLDDGKPQPQAAESPSGTAVRLAKPIKYVRQEFRRDALTFVNHLNFRRRSIAPSVTRTVFPRGVNLTALDSRFHTACCIRVESHKT